MPAEGQPDASKRPATARVFFALWPPADIAEQLGRIADDAAARLGGRPTRPETIHLTLAFLGNVPVARLAELSAAAAGVVGEAFTLRIDRLGFWAHNHLLWAGSSDAVMPLAQLAGHLHQALARAGFRAGGEGRDFTPHISLVRRVPAVAEASVMPCLPTFGTLSWHCERFVLIRSSLSPSGSAYQIIDEFPLSYTKTP